MTTLDSPASSNGTNDLALQIECVPRDLADIPISPLNHLMRRHKVAHKQEDVHQHMLSDGHNVRAADFDDVDLVLDGSVEVDVVGPDTGGNSQLEFGCLFDELGGEVAGVEGGGDEDVGVREVLLEGAVGAFFVARDLCRAP